jgi:programmed cell death 6-interacting protein
VDSSLKDREDALQTLENGYSKYKEIISNLDVGRKFYNDLARLLQRFRDEVRAWVYSRRVEAERLEVDITNAMHDLRISTPRQEQQPPLEVVGDVRPQRGDVPTTPMPGLWNGDARTAIKFAGPPGR